MGYQLGKVELIYYNNKKYKAVVIYEEGTYLGEFIVPRIVSNENVISFLQKEGKIL